MAINTMMGFLEMKEGGVVGGFGGKSGVYGAWWWTPEQCVYGEDCAEVGFTLILCLPTDQLRLHLTMFPLIKSNYREDRNLK